MICQPPSSTYADTQLPLLLHKDRIEPVFLSSPTHQNASSEATIISQDVPSLLLFDSSHLLFNGLSHAISLPLQVGLQLIMLTKVVLLLLVLSVFSAPDWTKLNDLFRLMINQRVFPGGSVSVANQTHVIYSKNFGYLGYSYQLHDVEVTNSTKYDIASFTKVMATTLAVMNLASSNSIKLDDLVSKYITNYDTNKKGNTTIANLMLHNSGLPYDYNYPIPRTTEEILENITFAKPDFPVGTKFQYSNLGFLLLGQIVSQVSKKSFDKYFDQNKVFAGLTKTSFNPPQSQWYNVAPTEYDAQTRKNIIRGQAHQRLAYFFGGVAGHSGLFSTSEDIIRFMRILLCKGKLPNEPTRVISEALVNQFTTRVTGLSYDNKRAYGFDTACPGTKMVNCFGHDGSTGIMAWADKDKKIAFTVVTNRGHPDAKNGLFDSYKGRIADTIMEALGY